jgi:nitrite reductase/ring-hydroxylating ferredoxin subunit
MADFVEVLDVEKLPAGKCMTTNAGGREIALFNVDGEIFATDDACAHAGASLGSGKFDGKTVTCRAHGLRYDVTTGKVIGSPEIGVQAYPAKIENGKIFVAVT